MEYDFLIITTKLYKWPQSACFFLAYLLIPNLSKKCDAGTGNR